MPQAALCHLCGHQWPEFGLFLERAGGEEVGQPFKWEQNACDLINSGLPHSSISGGGGGGGGRVAGRPAAARSLTHALATARGEEV